MKKYFDGMVVKASEIIDDENNWQLDCVNTFLKIAYYVGVNQASGLCTSVYLDGTGNCTIQRDE